MKLTTQKRDYTQVKINKGKGTATYWSVYDQRYVTMPLQSVPDQELAAMTPEAREKAIAAIRAAQSILK